MASKPGSRAAFTRAPDLVGAERQRSGDHPKQCEITAVTCATKKKGYGQQLFSIYSIRLLRGIILLKPHNGTSIWCVHQGCGSVWNVAIITGNFGRKGVLNTETGIDTADSTDSVVSSSLPSSSQLRISAVRHGPLIVDYMQSPGDATSHFLTGPRALAPHSLMEMLPRVRWRTQTKIKQRNHYFLLFHLSLWVSTE